MSAPQRLVLLLGGALGLLMVFAAPGWFGGADEGTHVMRSLALAHGTGGNLGTRTGAATLILGQEGA